MFLYTSCDFLFKGTLRIATVAGGWNGDGQGQASDSPICAGAGNVNHAVVVWCGNLPVETGLLNSEIERIKSHDRNERKAKQS